MDSNFGLLLNIGNCKDVYEKQNYHRNELSLEDIHA